MFSTSIKLPCLSTAKSQTHFFLLLFFLTVHITIHFCHSFLPYAVEPSPLPQPKVSVQMEEGRGESTGADMHQERVKSHNPTSRRFTIIVLSTLFSVIGIIALSFGALLGTGFYRSKMRDQYL